MTCRRILAADIWFVAVDTNESLVLIDRRQFFADVLSQSVFVVTLGARGDRDVRFQAAQGRRFCDVDVTRGALQHVVLLFAST